MNDETAFEELLDLFTCHRDVPWQNVGGCMYNDMFVMFCLNSILTIQDFFMDNKSKDFVSIPPCHHGPYYVANAGQLETLSVAKKQEFKTSLRRWWSKTCREEHWCWGQCWRIGFSIQGDPDYKVEITCESTIRFRLFDNWLQQRWLSWFHAPTRRGNSGQSSSPCQICNDDSFCKAWTHDL